MEIWDICNANGEKSGKTIARGEGLQDGEFHIAVEVWIINPSGKVLIQKRSQARELLPGIWALTTGSIQAGETSVEGCVREAREEVGIDLAIENIKLIERIVRKDTIWDVYYIRQDFDLNSAKIQVEEVDEIKWAGLDEMREMLAEGTLYLYPEIYRIMDYLEAAEMAAG